MSGGFFDRWSRRKLGAEPDREAEPEERARAAPPAPGAEPSGGAGIAASAAGDRDPAEPEAAAGTAEAPDEALIASLPSIEEITAGTDIRAFMQKGVPVALRNAALRRAWLADPLIAGYEDPARDYFWDWNAPGGAPGGGGALDPDRVARMVRDIVGPKEPPVQHASATAEESQDLASADDAAGPPSPSPAPTPGPDPATAASATAGPQQPSPQSGPQPDQTALAGLPRRRHGGAMPG